MRLISKIHIKGFRSIKDAVISDIGNFTVLAGLNNSGKSNLLRALNAFFNEETDINQKINIKNDFYKFYKKRKKEIMISITFNLPEKFNFRKGLESVAEYLGREFTISKIWTLDQENPQYMLNEDKIPQEDYDKINKINIFLRLINFRYIPNRVLPIEVIKNQREALRDVFLRRLRGKAKEAPEIFDKINDISEKFIKDINNHFKNIFPDTDKISLATPTSWKDIAFLFGYKILSGGVEIDDIYQGSGIQSILMFETFHLIDKDNYKQFGWRQASIWAIEEPESSLHSSLEVVFSKYLSEVSNEQNNRLQIFATSHSEFIAQYSDNLIYTEKENNETKFIHYPDKKEGINKLAKSGISKWIHPLLYHPLDPIILVEGKYDYIFWKEALKYFRTKRSVEVTYLEKFDKGQGSGGAERIYSYIKNNVRAIKARPNNAPIILVLDWDQRNKDQKYHRLFQNNDPFKILIWPEEYLNPKIDESFKGIERAYSNRIIEKAIQKGAQISTIRTGNDEKWFCRKIQEVKRILNQIIEQEGLKENDLEYARGFIEQVLQEAGVL